MHTLQKCLNNIVSGALQYDRFDTTEYCIAFAASIVS